MNTLTKAGLAIALVAATILVCSVPLGAQEAQSGSAKDPLLDSLNGEFRTQYQQALAGTLAHAGPVILEEGDDLILVRHGMRTTVRVKPVAYHELKAVAHVPLALFVMLAFPPQTHLPADHLERLRHYRELMQSASSKTPRRVSALSTPKRSGTRKMRSTCWLPMWWTNPRARLSLVTRCACIATCLPTRPELTWILIRLRLSRESGEFVASNSKRRRKSGPKAWKT